MNIDLSIAQFLVDQGFVSNASVETLVSLPSSFVGEDLISRLERLQWLSPMQAQQARDLVAGARSRGEIRTQVSPDGPATQFMTQGEAQRLSLGSLQCDSNLQSQALRLSQDYRALAQKVPLFAVHADMVFERRELLGQGGMGAVYRVFDQRLQRQAALKVLVDDESSAKLAKRFLRELKLTASLEHPSIPPVYEAGRTVQGELYLLMKVIEGETFENFILERSAQSAREASLRECLEVLIKVAEAVAYAHAQGVLHRDLKPANIMVGQFGEVMLMDWGIACRMDNADESEVEDTRLRSFTQSELQTAGLTREGSLLGTIGYMAPEQAAGEGPYDERVDIYALGAMLMQLLTGELPVGGDSELIRLVGTAEGRVRRPLELNSSVPPELDALVAYATAADKRRRMADAKFLVRELRSFLAGEELECYQYNGWQRLMNQARRRPTWFVGLLAGFVILLLGSVMSLELLRAEDAVSKAELKELQARLALRNANADVKTQRDIDKALQLALDLAIRGAKPELIEANVESALRLAQRSESRLFEAATIYKIRGLTKPQTEIFEELTKRFGPCHRALMAGHQLYLDSRRLKNVEMTEALEKVLYTQDHRDADEAIVKFAKGVKAHSQRRYREALEWYTQSLTLQPLEVLTLESRGQLYIVLGERDKAYRDLSQAVELNPNGIRPLFDLAHLQLLQGRLKTARLTLTQALRKNADDFDLWLERAKIRLRLNDRLGAMEDCRNAQRVDRGRVEGFVLKARILNQSGQYKDALTSLRKALIVDANFAPIYYWRAQIYWSQNKLEACLSDLNKTLRLEPNHCLALDRRGVLYRRINQLDKAEADFRRVLELKPNYSRTLLNLGVVLSSKGKKAEALQQYSLAIRHDPKYARAYANRGHVHNSLGQFDDALFDFSKAIGLDTELSAAVLGRIDVLLKLKRRREAGAEISQALKRFRSKRVQSDLKALRARLRAMER